MGLFDEFGKALKKVENGIKKADPNKNPKDAEDQISRTGKEISGKAGESQLPLQPAVSLPAAPSGALPAGKSRQPHPGYAKIAAWMKTKYKERIAGTGDYQRTLQLEQISAEASSGLSAKVKKGFLEYLKKQNYEPLLK